MKWKPDPVAVAHAQLYTAPFDAVAERYDETFTASKIGRAQRASVWKELRYAFHAGDRILDIGCGTGVDACFLAERGVSVVACDSSSEMIAVATRRVRENNKTDSVFPCLLAAEHIASLRDGEAFDGAFSNFGALNCVEDLEHFAKDLATLLKPSATALLCWMGPCCLWETAWYLAHGNPGKAFRRFRRKRVSARLAEGAVVRVHYPSARLLSHIFARHFRLVSVKGIGVAVPPSYLEARANRFPRLFNLSMRVDSVLAHCPGIRAFADHILLEFRREDRASERAR
jgi:ubiquinone/menaquinone biosynthesis C-methylase UbiE